MSVASWIDKKYEKSHKSRIAAIEYVKVNGYPEATLEELELVIDNMKTYNIPAFLYGRTWFKAHFETIIKK